MTMRIPSTLLATIAFTAFAHAQNQFDSRITGYVGLRFPCDGSVQPVLRVQNVGNQTMTSCDIDVLKNGLTNNTFNWVLGVPAAPGQTRQPALPVVGGVQPGDVLEFRILTVNGQTDQDTDGNIMLVPMTDEKGSAPSYQVQVKVLTDDNPGETSWAIKDPLGAVVAASPAYTLPGSSFQTDLVLSADQCYNFEVYDSGGDGLGTTRADAYVKLVSVGTEVAAATGDFGELFRKGAQTGTDNGCMPSQLTPTADPIVSCGAMGLSLSGTSVLHATEVPGANKYQFRFTNITGQPAYLRNITSPARSLPLGPWATNPLKRGRKYNVNVRASFDNGTSWCAFGPSCVIGISSAAQLQSRSVGQAVATDATFRIFPDPSEDGLFNIALDGIEDASDVRIEVFNSTGERAAGMMLPAVLAGETRSLPMPALASGLYVVRVTVDGAMSTQRVVVR